MAAMKKYRAESFDQMQYLYGAVHDPLIHCVIRLSGHIDTAALQRAVSISLAAVPMIQCCFEIKATGPRWADRGFTGDDIVREVAAEGDEARQVERLLSSTIDIFREPQLKLYVLRSPSYDTLCIIINHMVCDGAGFKEYLYMLANLYTKCAAREDDIPAPAFYPRGVGQLFSGFSFLKKLGIFFLKYDISTQRRQIPYRFAGDPHTPFFATLELDKDALSRVKADAKRRGVTLNDMVLCAYIRALHRKTGGRRIVMPCPVDLRKYLNGRKHGICNLTSNYICDIDMDDGGPAERTLAQVAQQMKQQKESLSCLKSMISMELSFRLIPFAVMRYVFGKAFTIPVVSFTNLGVLDKAALIFGGVQAEDAYLTGAVKRTPFFQVSISTFHGRCTLSCNMFGTPGDRAEAESFLKDVKKELLSFTG